MPRRPIDPSGALPEHIDVRVTRRTYQALGRNAGRKREHLSEVVRAALIEYLKKEGDWDAVEG